MQSESATAQQYRRALLQASKASNAVPGDGAILNTLGVAQCRVGNYDEAIRTLSESDRLNSAGRENSLPADLAFLTIAQWRSGFVGPAQATLTRLRETMRLQPWAGDSESQEFLGQAELAVAERD